MRHLSSILRVKYLSSLVTLLFISTFLVIGACTPPSPPPPPPPPPNQAPIIESLMVDKQEVPTSTEVQIVAKANDADGDILTYQWSVNGGTISGEGSTVIWTVPAVSGNYTIKLTVSDSKGGIADESTSIAAIDRPNNPPVVTGMTIDGAAPVAENTARQWVTKTIHCNVDDPDGDQLSYLWRATGGKITGEGSTVGWTSPGVSGQYTLTVVVSDGRGGKAEGSVTFKVLCCGKG
jgi:hypothetical protein